MHKTLKLGDVGNQTGPRANVVKGGPLTERDFHLGTGLTTRKNTEACLLAKVGKPNRLSVGRRCAAPEKPDAIQARPAQIFKNFESGSTACFSPISKQLGRTQRGKRCALHFRGSGRMNRRRLSNGLDRKQVNELHRGWEHAERIGRPAAWARECNQDGTGEHLHVLMHVPPKQYSDLEEKLIGWFSEPGAADVRPANQRVFITDTGKRMSAIGYIAKQMTPQAWYRRGLIRKAGGPIFGKRGGVTRNIGGKAIEAYFNARASWPRTTEVANDRRGF